MAKKKPKSRNNQYAAIPVRVSRNGKTRVLLLTSRGKGRWGVPKGWPMPKLSPADTARREAFEEAGLKGRVICRQAIGRYRYSKKLGSEHGKITVKVFVMRVDRQLSKWPEKPERKTRWFSLDQAAARVPHPGLGRILRKAAKLAQAQA